MNEDELRRMLAATPDEPPLPTDPVAAVRRKGSALRRRRQVTAGTLAVAVLAAAGGIAVGIPGQHATGDHSTVQVATDPPTTPPTTEAISEPMTPPATTGQTALPFTWAVHVSGNQVTIGGTWDGTATSPTAADLPPAAERSTGAQVGSGVLGWEVLLQTPTGGPVPDSVQPASFDSTNGTLPARCSAAPTVQHRALPARTFTVGASGTYRLDMRSQTCAGERDDVVPLTIGEGLVFGWDVHVYGDLVQVGGSWSGTSPLLTGIAEPDGTVVPSGGARAVVGHADLDTGSGVVQGAGFHGERTIAAPLTSSTDQAGSAPRCGTTPQPVTSAVADPWWVRFPHAGTYTLRMSSLTCAGEVDSTTTVTVGDADPFVITISPSSGTYEDGTPVTYTATVSGPMASLPIQFYEIAPDGFQVQEQSPNGAGACTPSGQNRRTVSITLPAGDPVITSATYPSSWHIVAALQCDGGSSPGFPIDVATATIRVTPKASSSPAATRS